MRRSQAEHPTSMVVDRDQPVIATPLIEDGREVGRYAVEDAAAETAKEPGALPESVRKL